MFLCSIVANHTKGNPSDRMERTEGGVLTPYEKMEYKQK